ncbi:general secretion pathway protein GspK [Methylococcaceae bacterium WWC4]|nr:general secretion pathway protein GspK [Methylococcaceae bacterium WWC4]
MPTRINRQSGFALVIVIWILTLLSIMAGSFALSMRRESSVSYALHKNAEAMAIAESGINLAIFRLQQTDKEQRWLSDGSVYQVPTVDGVTRIKILAESGKVDINAGKEELLQAVIAGATSDEKEQARLVDAIVDWRDADDEPRQHGAERKEYQQAGLRQRPGNRPFQSVEELQQVIGIDAELLERLRPWLTVYSEQAEVDFKVADPKLLQIIGADLKERNVHDVYLDNRLAAQSSDQEDTGETGEDSGIAENQAFTIMVETRIGEDAGAGLEAVIKFQNQNPDEPPIKILDWRPRQDALSLFDSAMESQLIFVQE